MNFVLGIIGDSYVEVKDEFQDVKDIFVEGSELLTFHVLVRSTTLRLTHTRCLRVIHVSSSR